MGGRGRAMRTPAPATFGARAAGTDSGLETQSPAASAVTAIGRGHGRGLGTPQGVVEARRPRCAGPPAAVPVQCPRPAVSFKTGTFNFFEKNNFFSKF